MVYSTNQPLSSLHLQHVFQFLKCQRGNRSSKVFPKDSAYHFPLSANICTTTILLYNIPLWTCCFVHIMHSSLISSVLIWNHCYLMTKLPSVTLPLYMAVLAACATMLKIGTTIIMNQHLLLCHSL